MILTDYSNNEISRYIFPNLYNHYILFLCRIHCNLSTKPNFNLEFGQTNYENVFQNNECLFDFTLIFSPKH